MASFVTDDFFLVSHMMDGLITGRLTGTPEHRSDRNRRPFMVARVRSEASDGTSIPVNVVAFDAQACEVLCNLIEGDAVALRGSFTPKVWIDRQEQPHPVLDVVAHQVMATPEFQDR
ncbi:single-stranded DNA-binding protein [Delftia acidovorans]|uniref:single-stranded DNA-binding protein n=1 Tax=Delftia acidovorans TaxID=80866 RepID=UPI0028E8F86E|nr:single-stranded DNA-binding protein [Delftia acidovorans]